MVACFNNFYHKTLVGFCLNIGKRFFLEFSFKSQQKEYRFFLKTVLEVFKTALRLRDQHVFMWQSVKVSKVFNTLTLKQISWRTKTFFKKLEYHFLVETTKFENTSFRFKTALSDRMVTTKWNNHKEWSFASNYFIFFENFFQF